jgi:hypothetical protein
METHIHATLKARDRRPRSIGATVLNGGMLHLFAVSLPGSLTLRIRELMRDVF